MGKVGKFITSSGKILQDVVYQKLSKSVDYSRSHSKIKSRMLFETHNIKSQHRRLTFLAHSLYTYN